MARIAELRNLNDGWFGRGSLAPSKESVDRLAHQAEVVPGNAHVSAGADGSVIVEWEVGGREFFLSLERDGLLVYFVESSDGVLLDEREEPYTYARLRDFLTSEIRA